MHVHGIHVTDQLPTQPALKRASPIKPQRETPARFKTGYKASQVYVPNSADSKQSPRMLWRSLTNLSGLRLPSCSIQFTRGYSVATHSAILVRRPLYLPPMVYSSIVASSARSLARWLITLCCLSILLKHISYTRARKV